METILLHGDLEVLDHQRQRLEGLLSEEALSSDLQAELSDLLAEITRRMDRLKLGVEPLERQSAWELPH